ncbi:hypothetical protein [Methylocapsa sp. S129]|uniref:hypothetical protein n=1 Tax=Methylocapsa sp. S129 TaxID=1641869 RepID=UPI00131DEE34|nr:hypothetical protein [Methylocapsa sp. S129]
MPQDEFYFSKSRIAISLIGDGSALSTVDPLDPPPLVLPALPHASSASSSRNHASLRGLNCA